MDTNRAAWLPHKQARPLKVDHAPMPIPNADEVIIRVRAVAINPADNAVQTLGVVYTEFPIVIGCDAAGEIVDIGSAVKEHRKGDRVLVSVFNGAFQLYCPVKQTFAVKIPDNIPFSDACVLGLALATSMVCVFETDMLALSKPRVEPAGKNGQVVLVWGGASALGSCAIQMATAAGYEVTTTASLQNFEYCQKIGAVQCFDYKNENIVSEITHALKGKSMAGAFCAIGSEDVLAKCAQALDVLGGNKFISTVIPPFLPIGIQLPESVKIGQCWHKSLHESAIVQDLFSNWVSGALAAGTLKPAPSAQVVGQGLDNIQDAMDKLAQGGVSAKKIVVEIP